MKSKEERESHIIAGERCRVGDWLTLTTNSGKEWNLKLVEVVGDIAFFENDKVRVQIHSVTGKILVLRDAG